MFLSAKAPIFSRYVSKDAEFLPGNTLFDAFIDIQRIYNP